MTATPGRITTFYSYKGGTGRSMALANFAWLLAVSGKRVLTVDWDLEAPGLHRYFRPFLVDTDLLETDGLIDAFWQFAASALTNASSGDRSSSSDQATAVSEALEDSTRRLEWKFPSGGYIDFIGAGRQGATYSERVNTFDWKRFSELGGARILAHAKDYMRKEYQWVVIDSRTGVSDTSGICTVLMPDSVVACFTMNRQSVEGVTAILRSIRGYRSPTVDGSAIEFFPIAMRIENAESDKLDIVRPYARDLLADFLPRRARRSDRDYWDSMEIWYWPKYAFEEVLAAFGDVTGPYGAKRTMIGQVEEMSRLITGDANLRAPEVLKEDREKVLEKYVLGTKRIAQREENSQPTVAPKAAIDFRRNVLAKEQQWRYSGFHWRLLLSRRELDLLTVDDRKAFGNDATYYITQSERGDSLVNFIRSGFAYATGFAVAIAAGLYFAFDWLGLMLGRPLFSGDLAVIVSITWFGGLFLVGLVGSMRDTLPYGVTPLRVYELLLMAPFLRPIKEYAPDRVTS